MSDSDLHFTKEEQAEIIDLKGRGKTVNWIAQKFKVHYFKIRDVLSDNLNSDQLEKWEDKTYNFTTTREPKYYYDESINEMDFGTDLRLYQWDELNETEQALIDKEEHEELKQGYERFNN